MDPMEVTKEEESIKSEEMSMADSEFEPLDDEDIDDDAFEEVDIDGTTAVPVEPVDPLKETVLKQEEVLPFKCISCDMFFAKRRQYDQHMKHVHERPGDNSPCQFDGFRRDKYGIYICDYCCYETHTAMSMKFHLNRKHKNETTNTENEENPNNTENILEDSQFVPVTEDLGERQEKPKTSMPFKTRSRLKIPKLDVETEPLSEQSQNTKNGQGNKTEQTKIDESKGYRCSYCEYTNKHRNILVKHLEAEHGKDWNELTQRRREEISMYAAKEKTIILACLYCDFASTNRPTMAAHTRRRHTGYLQLYHLGIPSKDKPKKEFNCDKCTFVCDSKFKMEMHVGRKHTTELNFPCHYCGKRFKVKVDLSAHIKMQHEQIRQVCHVCGKILGSANALHIHQKREHFLPKFQCHICKRRVVSQENLDDHMSRIHENAPQFQCEQCGKVFTQPCKLKQHMRCHTGEKPYSCHLCGKSFARRSVYRQHMLIHTGKRPYVCDICGKTFTQKPGLICHRKSHPGEKPPLPVVYIDKILTEFNQKEGKKEEEIIEEQIDYEYMMES